MLALLCSFARIYSVFKTITSSNLFLLLNPSKPAFISIIALRGLLSLLLSREELDVRGGGGADSESAITK
jgi:hypothetical protein